MINTVEKLLLPVCTRDEVTSRVAVTVGCNSPWWVCSFCSLGQSALNTAGAHPSISVNKATTAKLTSASAKWITADTLNKATLRETVTT